MFSSGSRQEVNITWYPEIEEPIKSREKRYSLVLYILTGDVVHRLSDEEYGPPSPARSLM